ncbi:hypothetical protein EMMF5_005426 [Cystobasidiomycetes sp. EMM_F5]
MSRPCETAAIMSVGYSVPDRMPRGGERNPAALCYKLGPSINAQFRNNPPQLRIVDESEKRDGSIPVIQAEIESTAANHLFDREPQTNRKQSWLNEPRPGVSDVVEEGISVHYVNGADYDGTVRLVLRPKTQGAEIMVAEEVMDGSLVKKHLALPNNTPKGTYGE